MGMSERATFIHSFDIESHAFKFASLLGKKPKREDFTIATCFSPDPKGSFYPLALVWLYSIIGCFDRVPRLVMLCDGVVPELFKQFKGVDFLPMIWQLNTQGKQTQPYYNFCGKTQAILASSSLQTVWSDIDLLFVKDPLPDLRGTTFIQKSDRVAGGFYCLQRDDLPSYLRYLIEELGTEHPNLGSDQKLMQRVLLRANISYNKWPNNPPYFLHLDKKSVQNPAYKMAYSKAIQDLLEKV